MNLHITILYSTCLWQWLIESKDFKESSYGLEIKRRKVSICKLGKCFKLNGAGALGVGGIKTRNWALLAVEIWGEEDTKVVGAG